MFLKNCFLSLFMIAVLYCFSYAGDLTLQEAGNYYNEGYTAYKNGDIDKAASSFQKTMLLDPSYRKYVLNNMGGIYAERGEFDKAEEAFKEALDLDPKYKTVLLNLGMLYSKLGDKAKAFEYWEKALKLDMPKSFIVDEHPEISK